MPEIDGQEYCEKCFGKTKCCTCGAELPDEDLVYREDPYNADIYSDYTLHRLCDRCHGDASNDI